MSEDLTTTAGIKAAVGAAGMRGPRFRARKPQDGQPPLHFEGGEHTLIGDSVMLRFPGADAPVRAGVSQLRLANGLQLTYGQIVALGGDFYGIPDKPISDGQGDADQQQRFTNAFNSLATSADAATEAPKILAVMKIEIDAVTTSIFNGEQPSAAYERLGDSLSEKWNIITGGAYLPPRLGRYLKLAFTNWDHFGTHAVDAYCAGHAVALNTALQAYNTQDPLQRKGFQILAYAQNAFADHFLSDLFSSGHLRAPRRELHFDSTPSQAGDWLVRQMHDEDCHYGLNVSNRNGMSWKMYGDKRLQDNVNDYNMLAVEQAVQASADEVFATFATGNVPAKADYEALRYTPILNFDPNDKTNTSPLWVTDAKGNCSYRSSLNNLDSYSWTSLWTAATLMPLMAAGHNPPDPLPGRMAAPASAPSITGFLGGGTFAPDWVSGASVRYAVSFVRANDETPTGPWSSWRPSGGWSQGQLGSVPIDPSGLALSRRIYRQFQRPDGTRTVTVPVGDVPDNATAVFVDTSLSQAWDYMGRTDLIGLSIGQRQGVWALTAAGGVLRFVGGRTWQQLPALPDGYPAGQVAAGDAATGCAGVGPVLYRFDGPSGAWVLLDSPPTLNSICMINGGTIVGLYGGVAPPMVFSGPIAQPPSSWTHFQANVQLSAISAAADGTLYGVGADTLMYKCAGQTFTALPGQQPFQAQGVAALDAHTVYATDMSQQVWQYGAVAGWKQLSGYGRNLAVTADDKLWMLTPVNGETVCAYVGDHVVQLPPVESEALDAPTASETRILAT